MIAEAPSDQWAKNGLGKVMWRPAIPLLEELVSSSSGTGRIVRNAAGATASMAMPESWDSVLGWIERPELAAQAATYFGRLGTQDALDTLAGMLSGAGALPAANALAQHHDRRATDTLLDALVDPEPRLTAHRISYPLHQGSLNTNTHPVVALARFQDAGVFDRLRDLLLRASDIEIDVREDLIANWEYVLRVAEENDRPAPAACFEDYQIIRPAYIERNARQARENNLYALAAGVASYPSGQADGALAEAAHRSGLELPAPPMHRAVVGAADEGTVPAWELDFPPGPDAHPGTRFGGQPSWRSEPTWPVEADGRPYSFWAQFELPWQPDQMAYLFIRNDLETGFESDASVLILQPGGRPPPTWVSEHHGPGVPNESHLADSRFGSRRQLSFQARVPSLREFLDPSDWEDDPDTASWNKIGGTPVWLQESTSSHLNKGRFLLEFSTDAAGHDIGDGAHGYGFINEATGACWFTADC